MLRHANIGADKSFCWVIVDMLFLAAVSAHDSLWLEK
jgi:hypothetical protein